MRILKFLPPGATPIERNDLMQAAFELALEALEIKFLDGGERYEKLAYAREVMKEFIASYEATAELLQNNERGK